VWWAFMVADWNIDVINIAIFVFAFSLFSRFMKVFMIPPRVVMQLVNQYG